MSINPTAAAQAVNNNVAYQKRAISAFERVRQAAFNSQPSHNGRHDGGGNGDSVELSRDARGTLAKTDGNGQDVAAESQTYDRNGQLARQIDTLQGGLSNLASSLRQTPRRAGIAAYVSGMQSRLSSLEMQI